MIAGSIWWSCDGVARFLHTVDWLEQHGKLITAEARRAVTLAHAGAQHLIAILMAEGIVDVLKPIEIDKNQREGGAGPGMAANGRFQPIHEQRPVGQFGQRVMLGEIGEAFFVGQARANVVEHE